MPWDPMSFFQAGSKLGEANKSPFNYGAQNVMDQFKFNRELGAKVGAEAGIENYKQQLQTQYEPQRKKAELETEYGLKRQFTGNLLGQLGIGGGDSSVSNDASKPAQAGALDAKKGNALQSASKGSYMVKSLNPMTGDLQLGNTAYDAAQKQAEIAPQVQQDQLKNSATEANAAALMMQKLDEIRSLHDKAMQGVQRATATAKSPFGLATRLGQGVQAGQLALQGPDNPDWQNYERSKKNFSFAADRGLFGEKGKLIAQQLNAGLLMFPGATGTKEGDQGLWKTLYSVPQKTIDYHNGMVDQYGGDQSLKIQNNSQYQQSDALRSDALRSEAEDAIKRGADPKKVMAKFKNMTGMEW